MKSKKVKIGRPHSLKNPCKVTISLSEADRKELEKQSKLSGSGISHYLRTLIREKQEANVF